MKPLFKLLASLGMILLLGNGYAQTCKFPFQNPDLRHSRHLGY
ncbi:MAG: hypothetical protein R2824_28685 [Saprospiraceae bacterium]